MSSVLRLVIPLALFTALYLFIAWNQERAMRAEDRDPPAPAPRDPPG